MVCGLDEHNDPGVCSLCHFVRGASPETARRGVEKVDDRHPLKRMIIRLALIACIGGPIWLVTFGLALLSAIPYGGSTGVFGALGFLLTLTLFGLTIWTVLAGIFGAIKRAANER